jgi:hypothetical protein
MLLIHLAALLSPSFSAGTPPPEPARVHGETHGKLPWFTGTYAEALAEAKSKNKILFVDIWREN